MMFANLMQRTKRIIQEKYLNMNTEPNMTATINEVEATDEQLDEKSQEMKDQIYGQFLRHLTYGRYI